MRQVTLKQSITCEGTGLHSGKLVSLRLRPAEAGTGILFHVKTTQGIQSISPEPGAVIATGLATTLGKNGTSVSTVEHLLAALRGLNIDNIHIDVEGGEIPIMDGSAAGFVRLLQKAGTQELEQPRTICRIKRPISFGKDDKFIKAEPYDGFFVDYTINFPHPAIGTQRLRLNLTPRSFTQVEKARTFGFLKDVEMLQSKGLALGGSLENAIVLDENGVVNNEGLRYANEFVRHKLLDFIGDMSMMALPLHGRFTVSCSGHSLNNEFLRYINTNAAQYLEQVTLDDGYAAPEFRPFHRPVEGLLIPA